MGCVDSNSFGTLFSSCFQSVVGGGDPTFMSLVIFALIVFGLLLFDLPLTFVFPMIIMTAFTISMLTGNAVMWGVFLLSLILAVIMFWAGFMTRSGGGKS